MNRLNVIQMIVNNVKAKTYVEIGVRSGTVFLSLKVSNKIGIDPDFQIPRREKLFHIVTLIKSHLLKMTSDVFFDKHAGKYLKEGIDVIFIDGMHTYEQSLKDVNNCLKYLNDNGVIVLHDCNPISKTGTIVPVELAKKESDYTGAWWGDVWKTIINLRSTRDDLNIFVLNEDHGLGIVRKGKPESSLGYSVKEIDVLKYDDLDADRINMLNLKEFESVDSLFLKK
jgi:hypothetical protein